MKKEQFKRDPVCGKRMNRNKAHITIRFENQDYLLCCPLCQTEFERHPEKYARQDGGQRSRGVTAD